MGASHADLVLAAAVRGGLNIQVDRIQHKPDFVHLAFQGGERVDMALQLERHFGRIDHLAVYKRSRSRERGRGVVPEGRSLHAEQGLILVYRVVIRPENLDRPRRPSGPNDANDS